MEGEVMAIEEEMVIKNMHNTLLVKEWVMLKRIATLSMVFLTR